MVHAESELVGLALRLGARELGSLTDQERALAAKSTPVSDPIVAESIHAIRRGHDPLGDAFCGLRSPVERRPMGATYTPHEIVSAMTTWGATQKPSRVVDPGSGSGRFIVAAGRAMPRAELVAMELDPLAALLSRAHIVTAGFASRARMIVGDYRSALLPSIGGSTLFLGNPPYVRHHAIDSAWKSWLTAKASAFGLNASQLAGLHVHFFVATALHGRAGDRGAFVTAGEWLDVNYGALVRRLLLGPLGGKSIHLIEPAALPFADVATTAAITCFAIGERPASMKLSRVESLDTLTHLDAGRVVGRARLEAAERWTPLTRDARKTPHGFIELGELCRVHRGAVTGANGVWIAGPHSVELPEAVLYPTVTKARNLFAAGTTLVDADSLRRVIDLPVDLDELPTNKRAAVERFLRAARSMGVDKGYIASHRRAWWSVGLRDPAPILATYMARRPPAIVRNLAEARHINIAHGIYPREAMSKRVLDALAKYLSRSVSLADGRMYAGGLTKFEPKEMERLLVPDPSLLLTYQAA